MIKVPRRIIYQLDRQIEAARKRVATAQADLSVLEAARAEMEPMELSHGNSGRARGGNARALALSADERTAIAQKGAAARWSKEPKET